MFPAKQEVVPSKQNGLGTFGGVFTPSILTILGVIMYLRFGWVVGNVGLIGTLVIVTLSTSITFLTALSISAIATDQRVRTGGAYYMISRSLGIESGGAIGIPLYLAQALSVALYTVGFAESLVEVFPLLNFKAVGLITTALVAVIAMISAQVAIKAQYFIMFGIALSLLSLLFGSAIAPASIDMTGLPKQQSESFWVVFAVFFPAVTGIMAGVNMSGDLRNPGKSIPRGTFAAVGTGYIIYMILPIILALRADAQTLVDDPFIMRRISLWGDALFIGVWGATLSSALGSILGAPRILQALARDGALPKWLGWMGKGAGRDDSPRIGTLITLVVALVAVWFGDLNLIAPVLTMFFLTTYGVLNVTAGLERLLGSPSYRPRLKVHWSLSLLGAVGCLVVMFLINPIATVVAFAFIALIFFWLQRREIKTAWGDIRNGLWTSLIRAALMRIEIDKSDKSWRPHPLVFSGAPTKRWHLIDFASGLTHNKSILTVAMILTAKDLKRSRQKTMEKHLHTFLVKRGIQGLVRVLPAPDILTGVTQLVSAYGMGRLVPNTVVLGNNENPDMLVPYCEMILRIYEQQRNVLIVNHQSKVGFGQRQRIDIWWGGLKGNGSLMMILAYLLHTSHSWWNAEVRVKMMVTDENAYTPTKINLTQVVEGMRTEAKAEVIYADGRSFNDVLHSSSEKADLIFLGLPKPDESDDFPAYFQQAQQRIKSLPTTVLVLAAEEISFGKVLLQQEVYQKS